MIRVTAISRASGISQRWCSLRNGATLISCGLYVSCSSAEYSNSQFHFSLDGLLVHSQLHLVGEALCLSKGWLPLGAHQQVRLGISCLFATRCICRKLQARKEALGMDKVPASGMDWPSGALSGQK